MATRLGPDVYYEDRMALEREYLMGTRFERRELLGVAALGIAAILLFALCLWQIGRIDFYQAPSMFDSYYSSTYDPSMMNTEPTTPPSAY